MADYVSREVARERLRKSCKLGTTCSVILLLCGLAYAAVVALVVTEIPVPRFVSNALYVVIPTLSDPLIAEVECAVRALLFLFMGLVGILMFRKVTKTGDAFRLGQLKQLRFLAILVFLLGFLPTVAANVAKMVVALRSSNSPLAVMSFAVEPMCIIGGLFLYVVARMLVSGAVLGHQEQLVQADPTAVTDEPSFAGVPDLSQIPTAQDSTLVGAPSTFDPVDTTLEQPPTDPFA